MAARLALADRDRAPGVVILTDVRGLHPYYELLADELARAGAHALAVDPYARTAGAAYRDDRFDYAPHAKATTAAGFAADVRAAAARLHGAGAAPIFVLGFCQGGRAAFMQASQPGIAGVVGFYGSPVSAEPGGRPPVEEAQAEQIRARVLGLFGGADEKITREHVESYDAALDSAGVPHELIVYRGAPHSFFDRAMDEHADACADAWARVLRFIDAGVEGAEAARDLRE